MSIISQTAAGSNDEEDLSGAFELVRVPMPTLSARERSIPVRPGDLTRLLLSDPSLAPSDHTRLGQFARLLGAVFHYEFYDWLTQLKELYAPIDPDSDCVRLKDCSLTLTDNAMKSFLGPFEDVMMRANFVPLDLPDLEKAIATPNELGLDYIPDLLQFDQLRVFVRGVGKVTRIVRHAGTMFRKRAIQYDAYRRVVIALKYKPTADLDEYVRSDVLYLRMFKDVPYIEMDMHLPEQGTKIRMRWIDKLQIASPVMTGIPTLAAKLLLAASFSPWLMTFALFAPISVGVKSFFGYKTARRRYLHYMIRHLYYLTMANNASVINRLVDSGEEEDFKEALLAYYVLWRGIDSPEPWDQARIDAEVETLLHEKTGLEIDFETGDALNKLLRLGIAQRSSQGHFRAASIERALEILDEQWDHYFCYHLEPSKARRPRRPRNC